ncbi:hypothetical protein BSG1_14293 [Bacillus sp. SG-1]|nr:hypothetical protein BSG1_14293 [Bacillus sp. SG-1]
MKRGGKDLNLETLPLKVNEMSNTGYGKRAAALR